MTARPDPTPLLRLRDGAYATDLAIAAIAELDLFARLGDRRLAPADVAAELGLAERPAAAMCTRSRASGCSIATARR